MLDHFIKFIHLNNESRYETNLPFKENHPLLYDHFDLCKSQLERLFKKLKNDKKLLKKCIDVFAEQLTQEIVEEAPEDCKVGECHYLPHHGIFQEDKNTSKTRICFDTSARSEGPSLNGCLYKGPQLTHRYLTFFTVSEHAQLL